MIPPKPATYKFKTTMRGLDIVQTVYALLVALGLREVFVAFYTIFAQQRVSWTQDFIVAALLFANIISLSLRFFWVPRNLRRIYFVSEYCRIKHIRAAATAPAETPSPALPAYETSCHIVIILAHGALYFLLCKQFDYYVFVSTYYTSYTRSVFATYVFIHASLLLLNAIWIAYLNARESSLLTSPDDRPPFLESRSESKLWYWNNLVFSLLVIAPLAVFSSCDTPLAACLSVAFPQGVRPFTVIPTSSINLAFIFDYLANAVSGSHARDFVLAIWAMVGLLANSLIDLGSTAAYYINLEEVEEETAYS